MKTIPVPTVGSIYRSKEPKGSERRVRVTENLTTLPKARVEPVDAAGKRIDGPRVAISHESLATRHTLESTKPTDLATILANEAP